MDFVVFEAPTKILSLKISSYLRILAFVYHATYDSQRVRTNAMSAYSYTAAAGYFKPRTLGQIS